MSKNNIRILIVEDDPDTALQTESLIYTLGYELLPTVNNSQAALKAIQESEPDVILMDTDIKGALNGIQVIEKIQPSEIPVIFTTDYEQESYYEMARKMQPSAYLIKPYSKYTFQTALENAIIQLSQKKQSSVDDVRQSRTEWNNEVWLKDSFFIKRNNLLQKVRIEDIQYIQSEGNYCEIFSIRKHAVKISLAQILRKLPAKHFVRIHQRCVINADLIDNIDLSTNQIYVGGKSLPLGPKYKHGLLNIANRL